MSIRLGVCIKNTVVERVIRLNVFSRKSILGMLLVVLLTGCTSQSMDIPVSNRTRPDKVVHGVHVVRPGETLFAIAWRYGRDYKTLARINGIASPYQIYPGQRVNLARSSTVSKLVRSAYNKPLTKTVIDHGTEKVYKKQTGFPIAVSHGARSIPQWRWPASGRVISRFSVKGQVNNGIDIAGKIGEPVRAAAAGSVVYAGSGLTGYGNLIIVRHNSSYLSAYAHSKVILVKEGSTVGAGQKIAEIGSTGTSEPKLHFEIRRNGKPVDPLLYLSKR